MTDIASCFPITDPTLIFFVVMLIILFAPIVMGKLRIPHIIGMVLAGVAVGQYGLNILVRDDSFELFGKVGLYYIMFLASLEMDIEGVRRNKGRFGVFGLLTFAVPFIMTYVACITMLHYSVLASLLLGCIMASRHTCQHHSDDVRNAQLAHHYRGKQNDEHHHEEDECGVGYGKTTGYIGHVGLSLGFDLRGDVVIILCAKLLKIRLKHS